MGAWFKRRCTARGGDAARRKPSGGRGKTGNSKYNWEVIQAILLNVSHFGLKYLSNDGTNRDRFYCKTFPKIHTFRPANKNLG